MIPKRLFIPRKESDTAGDHKTDYSTDMRAIENFNPINQLVAGSGVTLSPTNGEGPQVTVSASGGTGSGCLPACVVVNANQPVDSVIASPPTGAATIDGYAVQTGDRVLVQFAAGSRTDVNNGIWIANTAGAWTRPTDFANGATILDGTLIPIGENAGANYFSSTWTLAVIGGSSMVVGTTSTFEFFGTASQTTPMDNASVYTPSSIPSNNTVFTEPFCLKLHISTGTYQMDGTFPVVVGNGAVTLPGAAAVSNIVYILKDSGAGTLVIHPHGADTIDGSASTITPGAFGVRRFISQGSGSGNWYTI